MGVLYHHHHHIRLLKRWHMQLNNKLGFKKWTKQGVVKNVAAKVNSSPCTAYEQQSHGHVLLYCDATISSCPSLCMTSKMSDINDITDVERTMPRFLQSSSSLSRSVRLRCMMRWRRVWREKSYIYCRQQTVFNVSTVWLKNEPTLASSSFVKHALILIISE